VALANNPTTLSPNPSDALHSTNSRPAERSDAGSAVMSIDVEDWFHVENMRRVVPRDTWDRRELRIERSMDRLLEIMASCNVRATCFILGWVAERAPGLVRRIAAAGHEIASHGYGHDSVRELSQGAFRADVERSKYILEDLTSQRVRGYRAPGYSLTDWALPVLGELGFEYDSSFFPTTVTGDRYTRPVSLLESSGRIVRLGGVTEVPMSCLTVSRHALPWAGGGYFRILPYPVFKWGVRRIINSGERYIFYIHPWEFDPGQPRPRGLTPIQRIRHYVNLNRTEDRWAALLTDFRWTTIADLLQAESQVLLREPEHS
jgi:polysaccharide deacetylase family protein (PEP-CTERM system associated)